LDTSQIADIVGNTPFTSPQRGMQLHHFIVAQRLYRCLELGFAHGVGTTWIAGAIQELGHGKVVGVDVTAAKARQPSAPELIAKAELDDFVELHFDAASYTWHLQRHLAEYQADPFDFIFIDGAHNWDTDGFAFFLCEKILKAGGWILFDDLNWTYASSPSLRGSAWVQAMPEEQKNARQVRAIWEKLVQDHPAFGNFVEDGEWGWAQKTLADSAPRKLEIITPPVSPLRKAVDRTRRLFS
jgi:predicted O-methyltransferase YrrM